MGKPITDLSSVPTVGLDLAKPVFMFMVLTLLDARSFPRRSGARMFLSSSPKCLRALSGWKPVVRPIIGDVS